jgi:hypothetical protein
MNENLFGMWMSIIISTLFYIAGSTFGTWMWLAIALLNVILYVISTVLDVKHGR